MARAEVESSVIAAIGYSRRTRILEVEFKSGRVYRYFGVSRYRRDRLMTADSIGRHFNSHIRNMFTYTEVHYDTDTDTAD